MIVLHTNVVSEAMKPLADTTVSAWLDRQDEATLYLSSVTLAELRFSIATLPAGRRRTALAVALEQLLNLFDRRILPFDTSAANAYGDLAAKARSAGRALSFADGYIAAIAAAHGFAVASRDTAPFAAAGIDVIDPWQAPAWHR